MHPEIQVLMCRELFKLARRGGGPDGRPITGTKAQQWYFFFTAAFWLYLRYISVLCLQAMLVTKFLYRTSLTALTLLA